MKDPNGDELYESFSYEITTRFEEFRDAHIIYKKSNNAHDVIASLNNVRPRTIESIYFSSEFFKSYNLADIKRYLPCAEFAGLSLTFAPIIWARFELHAKDGRVDVVEEFDVGGVLEKRFVKGYTEATELDVKYRL